MLRTAHRIGKVPAEKAEPLRNKLILLENAIVTETAKSKNALGLARDLLDPTTPCYRYEAKRSEWKFVSMLWDVMPGDKQNLLGEIAKLIEGILVGRGFRKNITTLQEITMFGGSTVNDYSKYPFRPTGIIERELTISGANAARELQLFFGFFVPTPHYETALGADHKGRLVLEPLDKSGDTVRYPTPVYEEKIIQLLDDGTPVEEAVKACTIPHKKNPKFPYENTRH